MERRTFLMGIGTAAAMALLPALWQRAALAASASKTALTEIQNGWKSLLAANADIATSATPLKLTADEWRKRLTPKQFSVLREEDTEYPGSSPLNHELRPGIFVCAGCALPLFSSAMKFDSGTGWPSFFTSIPGGLATKTDFKLILPRTEYHCAKCGGHHGHLFDDGPAPTGQRWCSNGVALRFIPKT
jgi:peptide-methionine (R)-S-oxide reductase